MYIDSSNTNSGLFANNEGTVQNLKITDSYVHAKNETAGTYGIGVLVGKNTGTVQNCNNAGEMFYENNNANIISYVGGIVGDNRGQVTSCNNRGEVKFNTNCKDATIGGICGLVYTGNLEDSVNEGSITGEGISTNIAAMGGVAGYIYDNSTANNIKNIGEINISKLSANAVNIGGITGGVSKDSTMSEADNSGDINLKNASSTYYSAIGGIAGLNYERSTIQTCKNTKNISYDISGELTYIGGIVGDNDNESKAIYSYSKGNINGTSKCTKSTDIGRIVGLNINSSIISNCYTTGGMNDTGGSGTRNINFFHGYNTGTINNLYYLSETTAEGYDYSVRNFAETTSNMTKANFITQIGSNFFKTKAEEVYPVLIWE